MHIETWPLSKILPYDRNAKTHHVAVIAQSIKEFKIDQPIVVDAQGVIIKGHGRLKAAQQLGLTEFPVIVRTDLTPEQVRLARIADNRANEGGWDAALLDDELRDLWDTSPDVDFAALGLDDDWLEGLLTPDDTPLFADAPETDAGDLPVAPVVFTPTPDVAAQLAKLQERFGTADVEATLAQAVQVATTAPEVKRPPKIEVIEDTAPEIETVVPVTQPGDLWVCGRHRILCGDSTNAADMARLMNGEKAVLVHADPPYGMGKEKDGVANDNLYRDKLDAFQMAWWRAARSHVLDNGSAYIWGNAEDLWRLWYSIGGLCASERLTFRNEIIWDKESGQGMSSDTHRQFPTATERCLFFMIGEQGFNNNADNYWDGFTPIVEYLEQERQKAGFSIKDTKRLAGHSENSGCHWFDKSQWMMPTKEVYQAWQQHAEGEAFKRDYDDLKRDYDDLKRDYDDLKRDWYATRAFFDNTHDNMTDVWTFPRVTGDERYGHATPKPVAMIARILKSSSPEQTITLEPFLGSGTTLIAAEQTGRIAYCCEIAPKYVDVAVKRWETFTGHTAQKLA